MSDFIKNTVCPLIAYFTETISVLFVVVQSGLKSVYEHPKTQEYAANICLSAFSILQQFKANCIECYQSNKSIKRWIDEILYFYNMCNAGIVNRRFEPNYSHWVSVSILNFQNFNHYNDVAYGKEYFTKLNEQFDTFQVEGASAEDNQTDFDFNNIIKEWFQSILTIVKSDDGTNDAVITIKNNDRYNYTIVTKTKQDIPKFISFELSTVRFLSIEIFLPKSNTSYVVELDKRHFSIGNELFSPAFVKRLLEYQHNKFDFDFEYVIKIMDNNINSIELKNDKYILIENDKYSIMDL